MKALPRKYPWLRPRSGLDENSPALQRWVMPAALESPCSGRLNKPLTAIVNSAVRFTDCIGGLFLKPTDESVGYCNSSATPTLR